MRSNNKIIRNNSKAMTGKIQSILFLLSLVTLLFEYQASTIYSVCPLNVHGRVDVKAMKDVASGIKP